MLDICLDWTHLWMTGHACQSDSPLLRSHSTIFSLSKLYIAFLNSQYSFGVPIIACHESLPWGQHSVNQTSLVGASWCLYPHTGSQPNQLVEGMHWTPDTPTWMSWILRHSSCRLPGSPNTNLVHRRVQDDDQDKLVSIQVRDWCCMGKMSFKFFLEAC